MKRKCVPKEVRQNERTVSKWDNRKLAHVGQSCASIPQSQLPLYNATNRAYQRFVRREARRRGLL